MATAKQIMDTAAGYLGVKEYPPNSNNVQFNTDYYGGPVSGSAYPWCCAFVWDVFRMAGASDLFYGGEKTAWCPAVEAWGKSRQIDKGEGQYGDIVLFDWGCDGVADHIGLIEDRKADGTYITIEGNTAVGNDSNGGEVMRRIRSQSVIRMIIRPKYETEEMPEEPAADEPKTGGITCMVELEMLRRGSKGGTVASLQTLLIDRHGYSCGSYGADGDFGGGTLSAVVAFQRDHSLDADGIVGPATWGELLR